MEERHPDRQGERKGNKRGTEEAKELKARSTGVPEVARASREASEGGGARGQLRGVGGRVWRDGGRLWKKGGRVWRDGGRVLRLGGRALRVGGRVWSVGESADLCVNWNECPHRLEIVASALAQVEIS